MSLAFEITREDVETVCINNGTTPNDAPTPQEWEEFINECMDVLDFDLIESSALCGDDMDDQVAYAYEEITSQLIDKGLI